MKQLIKNNLRFEFSAPVSYVCERVQKGGISISGVAINATVTRNGITYLASELEKSASGLKGKPILKDHDAKVDNIVGRVVSARFDGDKIVFDADIMDSAFGEKIKNGLVSEVSIGAGAEIIDKERDGKKERVATNIQFYELSFVAIPGDPGASVTMMNALAESYNQKISEEEKMENERIEKLEREIAALKEGQKVREKSETKAEVGNVTEDVKKDNFVYGRTAEGFSEMSIKTDSKGNFILE